MAGLDEPALASPGDTVPSGTSRSRRAPLDAACSDGGLARQLPAALARLLLQALAPEPTARSASATAQPDALMEIAVDPAGLSFEA